MVNASQPILALVLNAQKVQFARVELASLLTHVLV
jgi:hypothetical protein